MTYETRWEFIRPFVEGKSVLDIGPAELVGTVNREKITSWLHGRIAAVARQVVGLECNREQIAALGKLGYKLEFGNAESFQLGRRFDVVVAGELIEHLSNPGNFLDCARDHLVDQGQLLLTTPNRFSILTLNSVVRTGRVPVYEKPIAKHVMYYDSEALGSLLRRHGFTCIELSYCKWVGTPSASPLARSVVSLTARLRPALLPTLVAVAENHASIEQNRRSRQHGDRTR